MVFIVMNKRHISLRRPRVTTGGIRRLAVAGPRPKYTTSSAKADCLDCQGRLPCPPSQNETLPSSVCVCVCFVYNILLCLIREMPNDDDTLADTMNPNTGFVLTKLMEFEKFVNERLKPDLENVLRRRDENDQKIAQ